MGFIQNIKDNITDAIDKGRARKAEERKVQAEIDIEVNAVRVDERKNQATTTALFTEKLKGKQQREYIEGGGFLGKVSKGFSNMAENMAENQKHEGKRKQEKEPKPQSASDFKLDMPKFNF